MSNPKHQHTLCLIAQADSRIPRESLNEEYVRRSEHILPRGGLVGVGDVSVQLIQGKGWTFDRVRQAMFRPSGNPMVIQIFDYSDRK